MNNTELVAGLAIIIPTILLFIDLGFLVFGATVNDTICRNTVRIVAAGSPETAAQRAATAINKAKDDSGPLKNLRLAPGYPINQNVSPPNVPGPAGGEVTVKTSIDIQLPVSLEAFTHSNQVTVSSQQTFPYTFVRKNMGTVPN